MSVVSSVAYYALLFGYYIELCNLVKGYLKASIKETQIKKSHEKQNIEIVPSPTISSQKLSLKRTWHKPNLALPTENADLDYNAMMCMLDRDKTYQLILDTTLSPALDGASPIAPRYIQAAWSPRGMLHHGRCLLATLTNMGAVKIEYMYNRRWFEVADISGCWVDFCRAHWCGVDKLSVDDQFKILCLRASQLRTVAISWSSSRGSMSDCHSLLAMAQRDGVLAVWKIGMVRVVVGRGCPVASPDPELVLTFSSQLSHISVLSWNKLGDTSGSLIVGDKSGVVRAWTLSEGVKNDKNDDNKKVTTAEEDSQHKGNVPLLCGEHNDLYSTADRIQVTHINSCPMPGVADQNLITVTKSNILLVYLVDPEWKVLHTAVERFKDIAISGLVIFKPGHIVVSTHSGNLFYLEVSLQKSPSDEKTKLTIKNSPVPSNINFTHNACFGIAASNNLMLWIAASSVNKMYDHLILRQPTNMSFFTMSNSVQALPLLVENLSSKLTRYWDCLEVIRLQCQRFGQRPPIDVSVEDLDTLNSYQLRLSLWLTVIGLNVTTDLDHETNDRLMNIYKRTKELIFARHACDRVEHMLTSVVSTGALATEEELSSINLLRMWMLNFMERCNSSVSTTTNTRVSNILSGSQGLEELIKEYCAVCECEVEKTSSADDKWFFAVCTNGHSIPRCTSSLIPCVNPPYYLCQICRTPTHAAFVTTEEPLCVFCDSILRPDENIGPKE